MASIFGFGYRDLEGSVLTWGSRYIFRRGELDLVPNRHQMSDYNHPHLQDFAEMVVGMIARLEPIARKMSITSREVVTLISDAHFLEGHKVVLQGSPNASHGYFYVTVSLMPSDKAPDHEEIPK